MNQPISAAVKKLCINNDGKLMVFAKNKRKFASFNDITISVENDSIRANKLVLSCYSDYFSKIFEKNQDPKQDVLEINRFDHKTIATLIDYIYGETITLNHENAPKFVAAADHLQLEVVKQACLDILLEQMTINIKIKAQRQTVRPNIIPKQPNQLNFFDVQQGPITEIIREYFQTVVQTPTFQKLSKDMLLLVLKETKMATELNFSAITAWVKCSNRELFAVFKSIDLRMVTFEFIEETLLQHPLVQGSSECLSLVNRELCNKFRQRIMRQEEQKVTSLKILCVGGDKCSTVAVIHSLFGKTYYPNLPHNNLSGHCVERVNDFVYCIGGIEEMNQLSQNGFRMDTKKEKKTWDAIAPMQDRRNFHTSAFYKGKLVVAGGNDKNRILNTVELYENTKWKYLVHLRCGRSMHAMAACDDYMLVIGGDLSFGVEASSTVEKLNELEDEWNYAASMSVGRKRFAAVTCDGVIYAIAGISSGPNTVHKSVEKYDVVTDTWSFVSEMNVARYGHSACVIQGRIFVAGGMNSTGNKIKTLECYDSAIDNWSIIGDVDFEIEGHVLVAV